MYRMVFQNGQTNLGISGCIWIPTGAGTPWFRAPAAWRARDGSPTGARRSLRKRWWKIPAVSHRKNDEKRRVFSVN